MPSIPIFEASELGVGEMRQVHLPDGTVIAVYNVDGSFYATADACSHGAVSLSEEGTLIGATIECSWHFGTFDVTTGAATGMPCEHALRTFPVGVEDGVVHVEI